MPWCLGPDPETGKMVWQYSLMELEHWNEIHKERIEREMRELKEKEKRNENPEVDIP